MFCVSTALPSKITVCGSEAKILIGKSRFVQNGNLISDWYFKKKKYFFQIRLLLIFNWLQINIILILGIIL
jgi:hypothetical protein